MLCFPEHTLESVFDLLFRRMGDVTQKSVHRHHNARSAKATLRAVSFGDSLLNGMQIGRRGSADTADAFDGCHGESVQGTEWS